MLESTSDLSGYAMQADACYIYIRGEFVHAATNVLERGDRRAYAKGYAGKNIQGSGWDCEMSCTAAPAPTSAARRRR